MVKDLNARRRRARADKLLEEHIENLLTSSEEANLSGDELELEHIARQADAYLRMMEALFDRFDIRSPAGNKGKPSRSTSCSRQ